MLLIWKRTVTYWALGIASGVAAGGCACAPDSSSQDTAGKVRLRAEVLAGFEQAPSRLFIAKGRLIDLVSRVGYDADEYSYGCDRSSDGTSLRCWNYDRSGAILITKDQHPKACAVFPGSYLDDGDKPVAWYGKDAGEHKITFRNGTELFAPGFHLDARGRLFCYGGNYYDYAAGAARALPIRIASVDNPTVPIATSEIKGLLGGIFATEKRVFLVLRSRDRVVCEEFIRDGDKLRRTRQFDVRPPTRVAVEYVVAKDYDPVSDSFLIMVGRHLPLLGGPLWYVYDMETGKFREIGVFEGYAGFLDRNIFGRALEVASTQPSRLE